MESVTCKVYKSRVAASMNNKKCFSIFSAKRGIQFFSKHWKKTNKYDHEQIIQRDVDYISYKG